MEIIDYNLYILYLFLCLSLSVTVTVHTEAHTYKHRHKPFKGPAVKIKSKLCGLSRRFKMLRGNAE